MTAPSAIYDDVPAEIAYLIGHKETLIHCNKPIMHGVLSLEQLELLVEMEALVAGGREELARRPHYLHYAEPLSPMVHPDETIARLLFCTEHGIPVMYAPVTVGGATAPVTGAGNLVACLAESLSGLVIVQLKRPGWPVIFGGVPTVMDMSTAVAAYGAPELSLWSAALAEMAHYLRLPLMSTAGCTDAVTFDEQAAAESAISCLMAALSGANLVHDVGFAESAHHASLELIAATDEIISMIGVIMRGVEVSPKTLALDAIGQVGPGGHYLDKKHTLDHFRQSWMPLLMSRQSYERWTASGSQTLADRANARVRKIVREHQPEPLDPIVLAELDRMEEHWWQMIS
jgi:trimethylamine--corrinoid protein Co-methyltransferase